MKLKILLVVLGWALLTFFAVHIGIDTFRQSFQNVLWTQLFFGLILIIVAVIIRAQKWHVLFGQWMSRNAATRLYLAVLSFAAFSPLRAADLAAAPVLKKRWEIDPKVSVSGIFVEKVIDFGVVAIFAIPAIALYASSFFYFFIFAIVFCVLLFLTRKIFLIKRVKERFAAIRSLAIFFSPKRLMKLTAFSFFALSIELYAGFLLVDAFFDISLWSYVLLKPISIIIGILSFVPAGLGVESYSLATLFQLVGITTGTALAASIVTVRMLTMTLLVTIGQILLVCFHKKSL